MHMKRILAVVAATAICCVVTAPMTANAAVCTHSIKFQREVLAETTSYTHQYLANYDADGDGDADTIIFNCTVTVKTYETLNVCAKCGKTVSVEPNPRTESIHSDEENPFYE